MNLKNVIEHYPHCLLGGGELKKRNKMGGLRNAIDDCQDYCVTRGRREPCREVQFGGVSQMEDSRMNGLRGEQLALRASLRYCDLSECSFDQLLNVIITLGG